MMNAKTKTHIGQRAGSYLIQSFAHSFRISTPDISTPNVSSKEKNFTVWKKISSSYLSHQSLYGNTKNAKQCAQPYNPFGSMQLVCVMAQSGKRAFDSAPFYAASVQHGSLVNQSTLPHGLDRSHAIAWKWG
ncbi:hypothetical protein COCC4DRAFT_132940 [Bipolaris maydis ATCC 48331]|uniref:Uncharacterized protein n=2 Tax=Cochliobolus heterostrophus TaxID=5016 RepID=M2T754_COCH5|nr:uncharacterized protein COCC4DRAFT_132940 [Bipolaris maydis ATCC 48331]EMD93400.1 hypothetical protein COCHEDRAFT_1028585 [Bipolaris maydis C5]ENI07152.1 hypothetical protein COCC4DRAFT_132940 [Bipolaris maydis ATCC 48331]